MDQGPGARKAPGPGRNMNTMNQISPLLPADLDEALALLVEEPATQARLRWHLRTPYALALKATENARIVGFALGTLHADHATVDDVFVYPTSMGEGIGSGLVRALLAHMEAQGAAHQGVVALPDSAGFWERMGFVVQGGLLRYSSGTFDSASREEVVPLEAPHLLAVQRLFQRAFGADEVDDVRLMLRRSPALRKRINEPLGPFDLNIS